MKFMGVAEAKAGLSDAIVAAQTERVVITRHGRPVAVLLGVDGLDMEAVATASDPAFWRLIQQRRKQDTVPWSDVKARIKR